jgi:hypothetical protein
MWSLTGVTLHCWQQDAMVSSESWGRGMVRFLRESRQERKHFASAVCWCSGWVLGAFKLSVCLDTELVSGHEGLQ